MPTQTRAREKGAQRDSSAPVPSCFEWRKRYRLLLHLPGAQGALEGRPGHGELRDGDLETPVSISAAFAPQPAALNMAEGAALPQTEVRVGALLAAGRLHSP